MRVIRSLAEMTPDLRGATAALGNFDGVHLGHQSVIAQARSAAPGAPLAVLTFEPHPREVFAPNTAPFRLMNAEARANRLAKLGVDLLFELPFDPALYDLSDEAFCADILHTGLGLSHVTVGADFRFGKGRTGNAATLQAAGKTHGFGVTIAQLVTEGSAEVSSTAIRTALAEGNPRRAAAMLGHWHRIDGPVIHGEKRGRELGYPTANMSIEGLHRPAFGVYAVLADLRDGPQAGTYHGVASLGVRPMFGENTANLETFLFDFQGDLYGRHLSIALVDYLRGEEKFDSLDALITQMDADSAKARTLLSGLT